MAVGDVVVDEVWKSFRIYHQRRSTLKQAAVRWRGDVYDDFWALRELSFEVPAGTTLGIIGANGAGKSTILKVLARILVPDRGAVRVDGRVSALLELGAGFHPELTGRENIFLNGTILGMSKKDLVAKFDDIVAFAGVSQSIDNAVKTYSSGMQARLGFAVASSVDPDILIIDEVLAVGDEQFQRRCLERISELRAGGRTAIFVSHGLGQVQQICDTAVWLDNGSVVGSGDTDDVINAYLRSVSGVHRLDQEGRQRSGDGTVELDAEVVSGLTDTGVVLSGEPLVIRLSWSCREAVADASIAFRVHTADGLVIAGEQLRSMPRLEAGGGYVDFAIERLPLLPGSYHLSTVAADRRTGHVFDACDRMLDLDVVPRASELGSLGCVALRGKWSDPRHV
jgi:ABC-type polysaccharide/polyol phosphate transport system ATPase subunit